MRKGSALLIVLGMLAFMVISAVAFSAYMRYLRMPSSYLRRTSSSRHLVKAALAEAIDIVDAAVADNPHPGVGTGSIQYPRLGGRIDNRRNTWRNHVFIGTNVLVSAADTVSTLTLEGLAYLPPALINEVRYYSRHSLSATWHTFGYDCGRYAFCAVDVSDHLNVNKVPADIGRGSSPENRFSLAYVFENDAHTSYTIPPATWDAFMEKFVTFDVKQNPITPAGKGQSGGSSGSPTKLPIVSLADLNLAINYQLGDFRSYFPFADVLGGGGGEFVPVNTGPVAEMMRHMTFVADGVYPNAGGTGNQDDYDLDDEQFQPFAEADLRANNARTISRILDESSPGARRLRDAISRLGLVNLFDYLDEDDVPVSLAVPSVERVPMICGIGHTVNGSSVAVKSTTEDPAGNQISEDCREITDDNYAGVTDPGKRITPTAPDLTRTARYVKKYVLDKGKFIGGIRAGSIKAVVAYPFRRGIDLKDPGSFTIDGHVEFFLSTGDLKFRTGNQQDSLHLGDSAMSASDYNSDGVLHLPLPAQNCDFDDVTDESSAVREFDLTMRSGASAAMDAIDKNPLLTVTWEQAQVSEEIQGSDPVAYQWKNSGAPKRVDAKSAMPPIGADGAVDSSFATPAALRSYLDGNPTKQVALRMAVCLRVKNGDGKTVDLVPACMQDDSNFNRIENIRGSSTARVLSDNVGSAYPIMRFDCGASFVFSDTEFDKKAETQVEIVPKGGVICPDPRWNWAPEHWFKRDSAVTKDEWLQNCGKGVGGRDRDIFMATSDAGYMQSVYELAFLPRLAGRNFGEIDNELYGYLETLKNDGRDTWATDITGCRNWSRMWKTYYPYATTVPLPNPADVDTYDDFETLGTDRDGSGFISDGGGPKINPYSGDPNVLMAVFANTPESWWSASANTRSGLQAAERKADTFNKKYAFSQMNSRAKFDWKDLERIATTFAAKMKDQTDIDGWMDAYDELWSSDGTDDNKLMGAELQGDTDDLYGVDRKFLYGYWRDCFAVKQQLFLIFVRAEPMMMGGGAIGQTPPQLGARAVALVWRNPYPSSRPGPPKGGKTVLPNAPHQTRVLFYRQFD